MSPTPLHRALVALAVFTFASWGLIAAAIFLWAPGRSLAASAVSRVARAAAVSPSAGSLAAAAMTDLVPCGGRCVYSFAGMDDSSPDFSWSVKSGNDVDSEDASDHHAAAAGRDEFWFRDQGDEYVVHDHAIVGEVRDAVRPLREMGRQMGDVGREMGRRGAAMGRLSGKLGLLSGKLAFLEVRASREGSSRATREEIARLREQMAELRARIGHGAWTDRYDRDRLSIRMHELSERNKEMLRQVRERVREISRRARREGKAERPHANA